MSLAFILVLAGCARTAPGEPDIRIEPGEIDFGEVAVGEEVAGSAVVSNAGDADLHVRDVSIEGDEEGFSVAWPGPVVLPEGGATSVEVRFAPTADRDFAAVVQIESDDPRTPCAFVGVAGAGVAPLLVLDPPALDFGEVLVGCEVALGVTLTNAGSADLHVAGAEIAPASAEFSIEGLPAEGLDLEPGDGAVLDVAYAPLDEGADSAALRVTGADDAELAITASGQYAGSNLDVFEQYGDQPADVLIAVDAEMTFDRAAALAQFADLAAAALAAGGDFHLALAVADDGCVRGTTGWIDAATDPADVAAILDAMLDPDAAGLNSERAFMLLEAALAETSPGGCNEGFLRGESRLMLVGIGEEPDQSINPWSYYVALLQSYRDDPDDMVVSAVGGDYPSGCGSAAAYTGMYEATMATGGLFLSICDPAWGAGLAPLTATVDGGRDRFPLTADPVPDTLVVRVDGVTVADAWAWDPADNAVVFEPDRIPEAGATIEVEYTLMGECGGYAGSRCRTTIQRGLGRGVRLGRVVPSHHAERGRPSARGEATSLRQAERGRPSARGEATSLRQAERGRPSARGEATSFLPGPGLVESRQVVYRGLRGAGRGSHAEPRSRRTGRRSERQGVAAPPNRIRPLQVVADRAPSALVAAVRLRWALRPVRATPRQAPWVR